MAYLAPDEGVPEESIERILEPDTARGDTLLGLQLRELATGMESYSFPVDREQVVDDYGGVQLGDETVAERLSAESYSELQELVNDLEPGRRGRAAD